MSKGNGRSESSSSDGSRSGVSFLLSKLVNENPALDLIGVGAGVAGLKISRELLTAGC